MNIINKLGKVSYFSWLMLLLGFCLQFSIAASNITFYLMTVSGLCLIAYRLFRQRELPWKQVLISPLWWLVTVWVLLLYLSIIYSEPSDQELMWNYARKYAKYLLLMVFSVVVLLQFKHHKDLPKYFFLGLIIGGVISFILSAVNGTTGWLTLLAKDGVIPKKYLVGGFWISNDFFAYSFFMAVVFLSGVVLWIKTRRWYFLILCGIGIFCVFVVSYQRTGFMAFGALVLWLIWLLTPSIKWKVVTFLSVILVVFVTFSTNNDVSKKFNTAISELKRCQININGLSANKAASCRSSIGLRMLFYSDSLKQIKQSPVYGHGLGNLNVRTIKFRYITAKAKGKSKKKREYYFDKNHNPHNEYLLQGIHLGIPGIVLVIAIFLLAYYYAMGIKSSRKYLYGGIVVMCAVSCLFNSYLLDNMQGLFFTVILSFIIAERINNRTIEANNKYSRG